MKLAERYERHVLAVVMLAALEQSETGQSDVTIKMTTFGDDVDGLTERRRSGIRRAIVRLIDVGLLLVHRGNDGLNYRLTTAGRLAAEKILEV